jgi:predicted pyridoxine 5'-phosphate oxidase superfamily flavin-nucleotide-binding protein
LEQLQSLYGEKLPTSVIKEIDHINDGYRKLIEAAPFVAVATSGPEGLDCSPKGDAPGFVRILDDKTLAIPDRPGNNRIDSFRNIMRDPRIALLFLIPGIGETLRVNGRASISIDPDLMQSFAVGGKLPRRCPDHSYRKRLFSLFEGDCALQALGRSNEDRPQEPSLNRHHRCRVEQREIRRRGLRSRGAGADQGPAVLAFAPIVPFVPAKAGTQVGLLLALDSCLRGNERT